MGKLTFKQGLKDGLPIGLGYLSVSFAFGVLAGSLNLNAFIAVLISMTNLTSAGQLAGVTIIAEAAAGAFVTIAVTELIINSRYFLMSITLSQRLDKDFTLPYRLLLAIGVTDEIFAVAVSKQRTINKDYFFGLTLLPYIGWSLGTLLGVLAGNVLPQIVCNALGIGLFAMFIAIIVPPSMNNKGVLFSVLLSGVLSCILYYVPIFKNISAGIKYIICALLTAGIIALIFPIKANTVNIDETEEKTTSKEGDGV